jgi:hypothetical protein
MVLVSQSERELVPDYDVGKKTDGYKPISIPKALKVIHGQVSNDLEVAEMSEKEQAVEKKIRTPLLKTVNCIHIPAADPLKSADWFEEYLGINRTAPGGSIRNGRFTNLPKKAERSFSIGCAPYCVCL